MAKDDLDEKGNEEQAQEDKPKSKKKLFIIIGVVVLVLVLGGVGAFFALSPKAEVATEEGGEEAKTEEATAEESAETEAAGALFPLETFIVNLQIKGSFLKTDIQLEFKTPEDMAKAEEAVPRLRDIIIQVLSSKTATEILTNEGKLKLKDEVKQNINDLLGEEKVIEVYFTEFIIQ